MIPTQIAQYPLIKVCRPDCKIQSHGDCQSPGKRPVRSVHADRPVSEIRQWVKQGGNYGVVARSDSRLIILDSDSEEFARAVRSELPGTFTVRTGSGNFHFYFESGYSENQSFGQGKTELGSVRTDNYQAVGPNSVHPDTGQEYTVHNDSPVNPVPAAQISDFVEEVNSGDFSREDGAAAGGGAGLHGKTHASDLEVKPTQKTLRALGFINSESRRREIAKVMDHSRPPRAVRIWAGGFLHSACGLTQSQIERLVSELAGWATESGRIRTEVRSLIQSSIKNRRASESVDLDRYLGPGDMDGNTSESRKTVESGEGRTLQGGENIMPETTFDKIEEVTVTESDGELQDGETCIRASVTEGNDGTDTFQFSQILAGTVEIDDTFGESASWQTEQRNGTATEKTRTIGSADPDYLRTVAEALEQLADQIED